MKRTIEYLGKTINLDQTDLSIIRILQEKGKITNLHLSKKIGLSPAPTLERVKKLENFGLIIGYHAEVNGPALGVGFTALVQVSLTRQIDNAIHNFIKAINNMPEIVECFQLTGNFDYQLKIMVRDIPAFEKLVREKLSKIEEIGQMQTMVVLSEIKNSHVIPMDYGTEH
ncbi:MAG: Lrp/AsnC family leucine-responsive transcriptional regulator [Sphingobacteriales bacterium]